MVTIYKTLFGVWNMNPLNDYCASIASASRIVSISFQAAVPYSNLLLVQWKYNKKQCNALLIKFLIILTEKQIFT